MQFKFFIFLISILSLIILPGCFEDKPKPIGGAVVSSSSAESSSSSSVNQYCSLFSGNSRDYQLCLGCLVSTNSHDLNTLALCVHANAGTTGGAGCTGLSCGAGQIPNFGTCSCQSSTTTTSGGSSTPGSDPTDITPYLFTGFSATNRYCPNGAGFKPIDCFWGWYGGSHNYPQDFSTPPPNVITDSGYIRWDLSTDNSQFTAMFRDDSITDDYSDSNLPFKYSSATFPGNFSLTYVLKPNTAISSANNNQIKFCDCVENYSNELSYNTLNQLVSTTPSSSCLTAQYACKSDVNNTNNTAYYTSLNGSTNGLSKILNVSLNGPAANSNLTVTDNSAVTNNLKLNVGMGKGNRQQKPGLFSNVGYYRYTFGPLQITRPGSNTVINTASASDLVSINTNLGFNPVSAVESSAFGIDSATLGTVTTRDCTDISDPCVVTAFYRSSGGGINYRSFSPKFPSQVSTIGTLPIGVTAVSTPKVVEDDSQLSENTSPSVANGIKKPSRLRVFIRASDGNIYMTSGSGGNWTNWISLGRPWISSKNANTSTIPPVEWAYTKTFADSIHADSSLIGSGLTLSNGIHIQGEPMVAYYKYNATPSSSSNQAVIILTVRVSEYGNATDIPGPYHNSVFYIVGKASGSTATGSFDNKFNWSRWMPMLDSTNQIVRIQGNPTVTTLNYGNASPFAVLMASLIPTSSSTTLQYLHPPIGFQNSFSGNNNAIYSGVNCIPFANCAANEAFGNWFRYSTQPMYAHLDLSKYFNGTFLCSYTNDTCSNTVNNVQTQVSSNWTVNKFTTSTETLGGVYTSDWTFVKYLDASNIQHIKMLSNILNGYKTTTNANCITNSPSFTAPFRQKNSCGIADNRNFTGSFELKYSTPNPSSSATVITEQSFQYTKTDFIGTPNAIALPQIRYAATNTNYKEFIDPEANLNSCGAGSCTAHSSYNAGAPNSTYTFYSNSTEKERSRLIIFGRFLREKVMTSLPSIQYMTTSYPASSSSNYTTYSTYMYDKSFMFGNYGEIMTHTINEPVNGYSRVQPVYPSSDVIPIYSNSLMRMGVDVPIYVFTRDQGGNLVMGFWGSSNNGQGLQSFLFTAIDGYIN